MLVVVAADVVAVVIIVVVVIAVLVLVIVLVLLVVVDVVVVVVVAVAAAVAVAFPSAFHAPGSEPKFKDSGSLNAWLCHCFCVSKEGFFIPKTSKTIIRF